MNYFKQILLVFSLCLWCGDAFGQTMIGIKGQVNNFDAPLVIKRDLFSKTLNNMLNPGFGIALQQPISQKWRLQIELNYQEDRQSFLLSGSESIINTSVIKYLRLPIILKRNIPFEHWRIQVLAGPNLGYGLQLLSGNTTLDYRQSQFVSLDFSEYEVSRYDLGLLLGLGVEKDVSQIFTTAISLRYHHGISDILKDDESYFFHRGYVLEMAIYVPLSKPTGE